MKTPRPLGVLRLLAPMLGRGRRRWRGGPLVPMIWRRRARARPAPGEKQARPTSIFRTYAFNLNLIWPARTAAPAAPTRILETRTHEIVRAGRDAGARETRRLVALVERLRLRPDKAGTPGAASSPAAPAREPMPRPPATDTRPDAPHASPHRDGPPAQPSMRAGGAPRLWPRVRKAARTALPAPAGGAPAHLTPDAAPAGPASAVRAAAGGPHTRPAGRARTQPPSRAGAMRIFHESRMVGLPSGDSAAPIPTRMLAGTLRRHEEARAGGARAEESRPSRPRAPLVWRSGEAQDQSAGAAPAYSTAHRISRTELVWRRPPAGPARDEAGSAPGAASASAAHSDVFVRADRPAASHPSAPAAPAPAALPPAEMGRLVDEVVRRLERIGRDERLRRGI